MYKIVIFVQLHVVFDIIIDVFLSYFTIDCPVVLSTPCTMHIIHFVTVSSLFALFHSTSKEDLVTGSKIF